MKSFPDPPLDPLRIGLVRQEAIIRSGFLSRATIHRMKRRGLPSHRSGGTVWIDLDELRAFLKSPQDQKPQPTNKTQP